MTKMLTEIERALADLVGALEDLTADTDMLFVGRVTYEREMAVAS